MKSFTYILGGALFGSVWHGNVGSGMVRQGKVLNLKWQEE